jgi:DNA-binding IclR family transcriptional regulator
VVEQHRRVVRQSVTARVAAIVLAVAARPHPSLTEVARMVGLPVSTTHRLLCGLVAGGLVERTVEGRYQLDLVGLHALAGPASLHAHITAAVSDLTEITGRPVRFGVWHERGVSYLDRGVHGPRRKCAERSVLPMHATAAGKVLLAFAPEIEVQRVVTRPMPAYTARTLATPETLCEALAAVRSCGAAVAGRELRADQWGIAAPVFGPRGVIAALEIVGRGFLPDLEGLTPALVCAARALGRRLSDQPALLPSGVGPTPLRWPVDPTSVAFNNDIWQPSDDAGAGGATRSGQHLPVVAGSSS